MDLILGHPPCTRTFYGPASSAHFPDFADFSLDQMPNSMQFRMLVSSSSWQHAMLVVFENLLDQLYFHPDLNPDMYLSALSNAIISPTHFSMPPLPPNF